MRRRKQHNDFGLKGKQDEGREQDAPGPRSFWGKGYGFWVIGSSEHLSQPQWKVAGDSPAFYAAFMLIVAYCAISCGT